MQPINHAFTGHRHLIVMSAIASAGALIAVVADLLSGWSNAPNAMGTAFSIDIQSIQGLFLNKPRWSFVLGNYLGVFFIPLHMLGFYVIYVALTPAGKKQALTFLCGAFYIISVGAGYHGTFAFVADMIQSGDQSLINRMLIYWYPWGMVLVIGYIVISLYLAVLILRGRTLYPRSAALFTPLPIVLMSAIAIALLPEAFTGAKAFLAVTGLNLPLLIFFVYTTLMFKKPPRMLQADIDGGYKPDGGAFE